MIGTMAATPACGAPCKSCHTWTPVVVVISMYTNNKALMGVPGAHCGWGGHLQVHGLKDEVGGRR